MKLKVYKQVTETLNNSATLQFSWHKLNLFLLKCLSRGTSQKPCTMQFYSELKSLEPFDTNFI